MLGARTRPASQRLPIDAMWILAGVAVTIPTAVLISESPLVGVLIVIAAALVIVVVAHPEVALAIILMAYGFSLVPALGGLDGTLVQTAAFGACLVGAVATLFRPTPGGSKSFVPLTALVLFSLVLGSLVGVDQIPPLQALQGVRLIITPLLCALIASRLDGHQLRVMMRLVTVILVGSAIAAGVEQSLGMLRLVNAGLDYGTSVRSFAGTLRAPGLSTTNYELGSFAGVAGALALTWWPNLEPGPRSFPWRLAAVLGSVICLVLSIYRTGIEVLVVAILTYLVIDKRPARLIRKLAVLGGGTVFFLYLQSAGFTSSSSLDERVAVWTRLLAEFPIRALGYGIGFSGSASGSRFALREVVVDNYFLSLLLQFGAVGLVLLLTLVAVAVKTTGAALRSAVLSSGATLLAVITAFALVDFWEYTAAMSLVLAAVAGSWHQAKNDTDDQRQAPRFSEFSSARRRPRAPISPPLTPGRVAKADE